MMKRFTAIVLVLMLLFCGAVVSSAESETAVSDTWYLTGEEYACQRNNIDTGIPYALGNIQLVVLLYADGIHWLAYFEKGIPEGSRNAFVELCNELNSMHTEGKFYISHSYFCYSIWVPHTDLSAASLSFDAGRVVWPLDNINANVDTILQTFVP